MLEVILLFLAGLPIGWALKNRRKLVKALGKASNVLIYSLLFVLGLAIGANKTLIADLAGLGWQSFVISIFTISGSLLLAWLAYKFFWK
jgi:uncharacterized membrane protein YbjE (DUF340 family)